MRETEETKEARSQQLRDFCSQLKKMSEDDLIAASHLIMLERLEREMKVGLVEEIKNNSLLIYTLDPHLKEYFLLAWSTFKKLREAGL